MVEQNEASAMHMKLELLLKTDAELVDLNKADASKPKDRQGIRAIVLPLQAKIESLVARLIRDHACEVSSSHDLRSVPGPLGSLSVEAARLDLSGQDLSMQTGPASLLQLAKWMRLRPSIVHLKLNGCQLDDTSAKLFEVAAHEDALPKLRVR